MTLPPLPEARPYGYIAKTEYLFTADQLREYATAAVMEERAACASACENVLRIRPYISPAVAWHGAATRCAEAIRARGEP